jgi:hypothetical protein
MDKYIGMEQAESLILSTALLMKFSAVRRP